MSETIVVDGLELLAADGIAERLEDFQTFMDNTNGCGAGGARIDLVPDTMWGLNISMICNLHDDGFVFCEASRRGFRESNKNLKHNLTIWNNAKSHGMLRLLRRIRIEIIYIAVSSPLGWRAFVACKKELNEL